MKKIRLVITLVLIATTFAVGAAQNKREAVLIAAFGTSMKSALVAYDKVEDQIRRRLPDAEIRWAYTSEFIRKKLKRQGIVKDSPTEALVKLHKDGFKTVTVQPLHVIPGLEYEEVLDEVRALKGKFKRVVVGAPLLGSYSSAEKVARLVLKNIPKRDKGEALVLMGHGTHHASNMFYVAMNSIFNEIDSKSFLGTVEGHPSLDDVKAKVKGYKKVTLLPFMVVAGDHAKNDMASDDKESWKSEFKRMGIKSRSILKGLTEYEDIAAIFADHLMEARSRKL